MSASAPAHGFVAPVCDEDALPFYRFAREGRLCLPRCADTGRWIFPPRPLSPFGPAHTRRAPVWEEVSGRGAIWSFVVPHPPLLPAFAERLPLVVALVALEEDATVRLAGTLVGPGGAPLAEADVAGVRIGAPVRVAFERMDDEWTLPRWELA